MINAAEIPNTMPTTSRRVTGKLDNRGVALWKERICDAAKRRYQMERHWEKCAALYRGEHWKFVNPNTGKLAIDRSFMLNGIILNLIPKYVHLACSIVDPGGLVPEAVPCDPSDDLSVISAKQTTSALRNLDRDNKSSTTDYNIAVLAAIFGTVFKADYWDDDAMATVPQPAVAFEEVQPGVLEMRRAKEQFVRGRYGDVKEEIVLPFEIFIPEGVRDIDCDAKWIVRKLIISRGRAERVYPEIKNYSTGETSPQDGSEGLELYKDTIRDKGSLYGSGESMNDPPVHLYECYEVDDDGQWARYVICGDHHINAGEQLRDFQPFRAFHWHRDPSGFWGIGLVSQLEKPQRIYNKYWTIADQASKRGLKPFLLLPKAPTGSKTTPITNEYYTAIEFKVGMMQAAPQFVNVPSIQADVFRILQSIPPIMNEIAGIGEVTQGKAPSNVRTSGMVQMLREQDTQPLAKIAEAHQSERLVSYQRKVALMRAGYNEDRWIDAVGQKYGGMPMIVNGDTIGRVGAVKLMETGRSPKSQMERKQFLDIVANSGLLQPQRKAELDELARQMNISGGETDPLFEEEEFARIQVLRENEWFRSGKVVPFVIGDGKAVPKQSVLVNQETGERLFEEHQDHARHMMHHLRTINSPEFRLWDKVAQQLYKFHADMEHSLYIGKMAEANKEAGFKDAERAAEIEQKKKMNPTGQTGNQDLIDDSAIDEILA